MSAPLRVHDRIDSFPTERIAGYDVRPGRAQPFGAILVPGGVNFSVFSSCATAMTLVLFRCGERTPCAELPFPESFRVGGVWAMTVFGLDYERVEYGYRVYGPQAAAWVTGSTRPGSSPTRTPRRCPGVMCGAPPRTGATRTSTGHG
jgi:glycogen operon protein